MPFFFSADCLIFTRINRNLVHRLLNYEKESNNHFVFGFSDITIDGSIDREREKKLLNTYHTSHSLRDYRCENTIGEKS